MQTNTANLRGLLTQIKASSLGDPWELALASGAYLVSLASEQSKSTGTESEHGSGLRNGVRSEGLNGGDAAVADLGAACLVPLGVRVDDHIVAARTGCHFAVGSTEVQEGEANIGTISAAAREVGLSRVALEAEIILNLYAEAREVGNREVADGVEGIRTIVDRVSEGKIARDIVLKNVGLQATRELNV